MFRTMQTSSAACALCAVGALAGAVAWLWRPWASGAPRSALSASVCTRKAWGPCTPFPQQGGSVPSAQPGAQLQPLCLAPPAARARCSWCRNGQAGPGTVATHAVAKLQTQPPSPASPSPPQRSLLGPQLSHRGSSSLGAPGPHVSRAAAASCGQERGPRGVHSLQPVLTALPLLTRRGCGRAAIGASRESCCTCGQRQSRPALTGLGQAGRGPALPGGCRRDAAGGRSSTVPAPASELLQGAATPHCPAIGRRVSKAPA